MFFFFFSPPRSVLSRLKRRQDLILCWHLQGAWTGIGWNELKSLSELERGLELERKQADFFFSPSFLALFIKGGGEDLRCAVQKGTAIMKM